MSRLYVGRLSNHANEKDVEKFFKGYGRLKEINLKNGFGFVVSALILLLHYSTYTLILTYVREILCAMNLFELECTDGFIRGK